MLSDTGWHRKAVDRLIVISTVDDIIQHILTDTPIPKELFATLPPWKAYTMARLALRCGLLNKGEVQYYLNLAQIADIVERGKTYGD